MARVPAGCDLAPLRRDHWFAESRKERGDLVHREQEGTRERRSFSWVWPIILSKPTLIVSTDSSADVQVRARSCVGSNKIGEVTIVRRRDRPRKLCVLVFHIGASQNETSLRPSAPARCIRGRLSTLPVAVFQASRRADSSRRSLARWKRWRRRS